jgi:hypothetical protein
MDYATVTVIEDEVLIVEVAQQGPMGAQGPQGPNGSAEVYIAASAISGHIVVTLDSAGQVIPADPNTAAHGNTIIGVTVGAAIGGDRYDVLGLLGFVWRRQTGTQSKWFCSEAVAAMLGFPEPWRFDPMTLWAAVQNGGRK